MLRAKQYRSGSDLQWLDNMPSTALDYLESYIWLGTCTFRSLAPWNQTKTVKRQPNLAI